MNDFRMPLFARYDMSVVFDQRTNWIRKRLRERWSAYITMTDAEIVSEFCDTETICPLELIRDDKNIRLIGKDRYELEISYRGDEEFWQLYPVEPLSNLDAEIFRLNLILQTFADSREKAERVFDADLDEIELILDQQYRRIEIFESALPSIVSGELAKLRYSYFGLHSQLVH